MPGRGCVLKYIHATASGCSQYWGVTARGREYSVTSGSFQEVDMQGPLFGAEFELLKAHNRPEGDLVNLGKQSLSVHRLELATIGRRRLFTAHPHCRFAH
jgi:hypothetical protein